MMIDLKNYISAGLATLGKNRVTWHSFSWLKGEVRENLKDWESFQIFKCFFLRYHIMKDINKILAI